MTTTERDNFTSIVLDANIWIKERLLRSGMGAALLWALRRTKSVLLLPYATRTEIINGATKQINLKALEIEDRLVTIRAFMGQSQQFNAPKPDEIKEVVDQRLMSFGSLLRECNHTTQHLEAALQRVLAHLPPAHKAEEYRDSLMWEMSLDFAASTGTRVVIITEDAAFYHLEKYENGLAFPLRSDLDRTGADISVYPSIKAYLSIFQEEQLKPDLEAISTALNEDVFKIVLKSVEDCSHSGIQLDSYDIKAFLTEVPDELAIDFVLKYAISNLTLPEGVVLPKAYGIAEGSATLSVHASKISNMQMTAYRIVSSEGQTVRQHGYAYMSGVIFGGPRYVPYTLRWKM